MSNASAADLRRQGFVGLMMCWPKPLPREGDYLSSGARARFNYRIVHVERFEQPRTVKRFTCRLWCERVAPDDVPSSARKLAFYWHKRPKAKGRR